MTRLILFCKTNNDISLNNKSLVGRRSLLLVVFWRNSVLMWHNDASNSVL